MPREETTTRTLYTFDELDDKAKQKAREWWRDASSGETDLDHMYDDFIECGKILGITIDNRTERSIRIDKDGGAITRVSYRPAIYWSGFWSQGDGACFEGSYAYAKGSKEKIRKHAPDVRKEFPKSLNHLLHEVADKLAEVQAKHFYKLTATVKHRGHYYHEFCTVIDVDGPNAISQDDEYRIADALRDFMKWMYRSLEAEYEWQNADEQVDENIRANEYEFTEEGERA